MGNVTASEDTSMPVDQPEKRRRVRIHRRDIVGFGAEPGMMARLVALEDEIVTRAVAKDPDCADFLEWWGDEWKYYGLPVKNGMAALYWTWSQVDASGHRYLTKDRFAAGRELLMESVADVELDGDMMSGRTIVQEFWWWSARDWRRLDYLVRAVDYFDTVAKADMKAWYHRRRRRLQAAKRKALREYYQAHAPAEGAPAAVAA